MSIRALQLSVLPAIAALVCEFLIANAAAQVPERGKTQTVSLGIVSEQVGRKSRTISANLCATSRQSSAPDRTSKAGW